MSVVIDQIGRPVALPAMPKRLISLCPSTTETLFHLVPPAHIVGVTDYCRHPADRIAALPKVGGTKTVDRQAVAAAAPDLILAVREENDRDQIAALAADWPVLVLDPVSVDTALAGIQLMGQALQSVRAAPLADRIASSWSALPDARGARCLYLIWRKPFMAAGAGTYIHDVLTRLGFDNAAADWPGRYPEVDLARMAEAGVALLLAASEPFPFAKKHLADFDGLPARALLVDGEAFSWHGAAMLRAVPEFQRVLAACQEEAG